MFASFFFSFIKRIFINDHQDLEFLGLYWVQPNENISNKYENDWKLSPIIVSFEIFNTVRK